MKWGILSVLVLMLAMAAPAYVQAIEVKDLDPAGAVSIKAEVAKDVTVKDLAAKPSPTGAGGQPAAAAPTGAKGPSVAADPVAQRKAREEAAQRILEFGRTRRTLQTGRPRAEFENMPIKDVLTNLSERGKFSVVYDPALEEAGVDLSARTVTIRAAGMTYEETISLILPAECGYRIEAGYVMVTTLQKSWLPLRTRTYSVQLALAEIPNFEGPRFEVSSILQSATQAVGGGGGAGGIFGANQPPAADETGKATPERIVDFVKKFVKNQTDRRIAPWDDEGGPATVQYMSGRLIISQTEQGHRAIAKLLASIE